ncbi:MULTISPECIES: alpha/beta hydrolase [Planococcus]|uniref:Lysophospholipase n=1 Tax=Planococcus faecalis TaxID=1598147 RepID=A0ABN4XGG9_9BACL|nr:MULTISPECIES: alpha/beta hydrolase [Planococcus]AQU78871.1 lysophospholipase [Planococcus faecalis]MDJ0333063.1 alpha/beta hydrolase [Planococcus sp. S3-L1]OHX54023.1 lysophospholipase [Planococcus faecalis]
MWKWQAEGSAKAVVVFIHSAYEQHLRYAWQIEKWRSAGFDVYTGDLPGHGKNAGADKVHRESFDDYEQAVNELLRLSSENELPVFVIAHGLGATIAMNVLGNRKFNVAGVIFTSPWLQLKKLPPKVPNAFPGVAQLTGRRKVDHGIELRHLTRDRFSYSQETESKRYQTVITASWYKELQSYMKETAASIDRYPQIPTCLYTAERDLIVEKEVARQWLLKQQLNEFSYKEWKFCYHDIFQEPEKEEVFLAAQAFIHTVLRSVGYLVEE